MTIVDPVRLLESLVAFPRETEWLEFKQNQFDEEDIGRYVSGLANAAMLHNEPCAYFVFGVEDKTHKIVGTAVRLKEKCVGNDPYEHWLSRMMHPTIHFEFVSFEYHGVHIEMICIHPAYLNPVRFKNDAYIRVDSILKPLRDQPERERSLWQLTSRFAFEKGVAGAHLSESDIFDAFDPVGLFNGLGVTRLSRAAIVARLVEEGLVNDNRQGGYDVTNLFVLLAARDIRQFPGLTLKTPRVVHYTGTSKAVAKDDVSGREGYGLSFTRLLKYIMDRVAHKEEMVHGTRRTIYAIPEIAVREFVVNALIHQDFTLQGSGPVVEIYSDRIRITNPGIPFVDPTRLIDAPARSRNEGLAGFMRKLGYFEGRGSGVDRAVEAIEASILPPPLWQTVDDSTVVTVFGPKSFSAMSKEERVRACYKHASVRWEANLPMSNQSLRTRFGLSEGQYPQASLVIADAREGGFIKPENEGQPNRLARYLPFWV